VFEECFDRVGCWKQKNRFSLDRDLSVLPSSVAYIASLVGRKTRIEVVFFFFNRCTSQLETVTPRRIRSVTFTSTVSFEKLRKKKRPNITLTPARLQLRQTSKNDVARVKVKTYRGELSLRKICLAMCVCWWRLKSSTYIQAYYGCTNGKNSCTVQCGAALQFYSFME